MTAWGHSQHSPHLPSDACACLNNTGFCFCIFAPCTAYAHVWEQNLGLKGSNFVQQHLKLASQINCHHCYLWRLGWKLDNLPNRNYCEALLNPGNLFLFSPHESPPNLLMWNHAGLDWHRTKKFCCCHLKLEFEKKES